MVETLSAAQARRMALAAQGFARAAGDRPGLADRRRVMRTIEQLGLIQIDSVNVVSRSHYLPLFSRLGAYDRSLLEDLAWGFNPVWQFGRPDLEGGLVAKTEAVAIWEQASGLKADPAALHWWTLFNCVKGQAIWVGSARAFIDGGNREPIMIYPAWWLLNAQDRAILKVMGRL